MLDSQDMSFSSRLDGLTNCNKESLRRPERRNDTFARTRHLPLGVATGTDPTELSGSRAPASGTQWRSVIHHPRPLLRKDGRIEPQSQARDLCRLDHRVFSNGPKERTVLPGARRS
jgi:hypothetical protein